MFTRREILQSAILASLWPVTSVASAGLTGNVLRKVPGSGESIPAIGMGTWQTFHLPSPKPVEIQKRVAVLEAFYAAGGTVIDSSPMYMNAQEVLGLCFDQIKSKKDSATSNTVFSATKVWSLREDLGLQQIDNAETLWREEQFDLMQVHNLLLWEKHLKNLQRFKHEKRIRYIGVTTSHQRRHKKLAEIMREQNLDFVQFSYNIENRKAEAELLPLAQEKNLAVMVNRPFQTGHLFQKVKGKPLPDWASEIRVSAWSQFFLKFIISHPAVTVAIPATSNVSHMQENMQAMKYPLPDQLMRKEMIRYYNSVVSK